MELLRPIICVVARVRGAAGSRERASLLSRLRSAAAAGASTVQIRERQMHDRALLEFAGELIQATRGTACLVTINDRTDLAIAAAAGGVHLKSGGVRSADVRRIAPVPFLIGRSVHSVEDAAAAEQDGGCDYLFFGTVFPSASKPEHHHVAGIGALKQVCASVALPVVAIGGMTPSGAAEAAAAGAAGVAAINFFAAARDIAEAVGSMAAALTRRSGHV